MLLGPPIWRYSDTLPPNGMPLLVEGPFPRLPFAPSKIWVGVSELTVLDGNQRKTALQVGGLDGLTGGQGRGPQAAEAGGRLQGDGVEGRKSPNVGWHVFLACLEDTLLGGGCLIRR